MHPTRERRVPILAAREMPAARVACGVRACRRRTASAQQQQIPLRRHVSFGLLPLRWCISAHALHPACARAASAAREGSQAWRHDSTCGAALRKEKNREKGSGVEVGLRARCAGSLRARGARQRQRGSGWWQVAWARPRLIAHYKRACSARCIRADQGGEPLLCCAVPERLVLAPLDGRGRPAAGDSRSWALPSFSFSWRAGADAAQRRRAALSLGRTLCGAAFARHRARCALTALRRSGAG
jgi:hypothetical protein